jgi:(p)ppGpp synthase/HD superfamily hydrolase
MNALDIHLPDLDSRFEEALIFATRLHQGQTRKGKDLPYISHLLAVTALVFQAGGGEDEVVAALLLDAVEDQGGLETLVEIRRRFGERVAMIVEGCSDSLGTPKPPWLERKANYLAHLATAPPEVRLVSLADKLHNARTILADLEEHGELTWELFNGGRQGSLWYYQSLVEIFQESESGYMLREFTRVVQEIHRLAGSAGSPV